MIIPKLKFKKISLEENINIILTAYLSKNSKALDIHNLLEEYFPELHNIHKNIAKEEISPTIKNIVSNYYTSNSQNIEEACQQYQKIWNKYNDTYFAKLSNYLNTKWPNDSKEIICYVGMLPFFPRNIDNYTFYINPHLNEENLIEACTHETLHFLWFKKWLEIYPETVKEEFESPHLPWLYSEMVTAPILNNTEFQKIFKFQEKGYSYFYTLYNDKILVMDKITEIFNSENSIEDKIKTGYKYLKNINFKERG
mgnify:CR=1 FL=1